MPFGIRLFLFETQKMGERAKMFEIHGELYYNKMCIRDSTDGMVLHQITQAGDRLGALKSRVEILQDRLERNREESQAALDQACAGRDQMVLQA